MKYVKYLLINLMALFCFLASAQTGFVNNGVSINVGQGAYITAVDFTNNQVSATNGTIDLDGTFQISGNIANNSTGNVFSNIEAIPDGSIVLNGNNQSINGSNPVFFENLKLNNALKTLNLNNCEVKGILTLNSELNLNKQKLIIDNKLPSAISYQNGFIRSETLPVDGLGEIEWRIGDQTGSYTVPFGSGLNNNDLSVNLLVNSAASPFTGSVVFATFPADAYNNPLPDGIFSLDTFKIENLADRYWKIDAQYSTKPDVTISFKYTDPDVDLADNPGLIQANLKTIRYNDMLGTWLDMKMTGTCDLTSKTVTINTVDAENFFPYWTLSEFELKIPNAFTPNNDGKNDVFLKDYDLKIINRWGEVLYEGKGGWDGTIDGKPVSPGTYYYVASIPDADNNLNSITGVITLVLPE